MGAVRSEDPAHGARFELARGSGPGVRYAVEVRAPGARWATRAHLEGGGWRLEPWSAEPPGWVAARVRRFLSVLRARHAGEGAPAWPRKVTRWRPAPGGAGR